MAAADEAELAAMISTAVGLDDRPCGFRYPARRRHRASLIPDLAAPLEIGRGRIVREGYRASRSCRSAPAFRTA